MELIETLSTGDVANKIGTYLKALAAHDNNVPFYVALPSSTIDWDINDFKKIPIEERNSEELSHVEGVDEKGNVKKVQIYPKKSKAMNLAFDITPAKYVTGLITEKGVCEASSEGLKKLINEHCIIIFLRLQNYQLLCWYFPIFFKQYS